MESMTLPASTPGAGLDARLLDLDSLLERLGTLTDARHPKGLRYALAPLLLLMILAKLSGEDRPSGIADWIRSRGGQLQQALHLAWSRMPHHNTYRRVLERVIPPRAFSKSAGV